MGRSEKAGSLLGVVVRVAWGASRPAELLSENQAREKQEDGENFPAGSHTLCQRKRPSHLPPLLANSSGLLLKGEI